MALDGSANGYKMIFKGVLTGLTLWTGAAIYFGIGKVAIIYGYIYGMPLGVLLGVAIIRKGCLGIAFLRTKMKLKRLKN